MSESRKYSLVLSPKGAEAQPLQALIDELAEAYGAPRFKPHITLVGNIPASDEELNAVKHRLAALAGELEQFPVTLTTYGFTDETYRCLYLLAEAPELATVYARTAGRFPQVHDEHFQSMPHLSVLYGAHQTAAKEQAIAAHPIAPISFQVRTLDLWLSDGPPPAWHEVYKAPLSE